MFKRLVICGCALICFLLCSCGTVVSEEGVSSEPPIVDASVAQEIVSSEAPVTDTIVSEEAVSSEAPVIDDLSIYDSVLKMYKEAVANNYYQGSDILPEEYPFEYLINVGYVSDYNTYYAFYDVDKNGYNELFIGAGDSACNAIYDVYTHNGSTPTRLFADFSFGARVNLRVYNDGIFEIIGSASAFESYHDYFRISSDGLKTETVNSLAETYSIENGETPTFTNNGAEITKEEFDNIIKQNTQSGQANIGWQILKP